MKQRKTFITLALIIAVLCLGIAYAAITGITLTINGSAKAVVGDGVVEVEFTDAKAGTNATVVTNATVENDPTKATFTVEGLKTKGEKATVDFTIENKSSDIPATLGTPTITLGQGGEWFNVTHTYSDTELDIGEEATLTLTIELIKVPTTDAAAQDATETITVTLNADPASNAI